MKKLNIQKLIIFLVIIAALVVALIFIFKGNKNEEKKASAEEAKIVETKTTNYLVELTAGYQSKYNGIEKLFSSNKTTSNDLSKASIIQTSIAYLRKNNKATIDNALISQIAREENIIIDSYDIYKGEQIKEAAKELFGIDLQHSSIMNEKDHIYTYWYLEKFDVYLIGLNPNYPSLTSYEYYVTPKVIQTTKDKNNNLKTEIAIAYVYIAENNTLKFSKDISMSNIICEGTSDNFEIPEDQTNEFDHYIFTFKNVDGNYVFDSVEKK